MTRATNATPWQPFPEGALVHPRERAAVIADVHLGYDWARAAAGDLVPAHALRETLARLDALFARAPLDRLVIAGDLFERSRPCLDAERDFRALRAWVEGQGAELVVLRGNHDPPRWPDSIEIDGWTIAHGHRPLDRPRLVLGHDHPAIRVESTIAPCFLIARDRIVLPAFSPNAAGRDVGSGWLPAVLRRRSPRCVAVLDGELFDLGPVNALQAHLRRSGPARTKALSEGAPAP